MSELTMERLADAEQLSVLETVTPEAEALPVAEALPIVEVQPKPNVVSCQRAVGGTAILCAGCPLVMFCPSVRQPETTPPTATSEVELPSGQDVVDSIFSNDIFDKPATEVVSDALRANPEMPNTVVELTSKADKSSEPRPTVEKEPSRSYLTELLDDSIEIVVAKNLRQPVVEVPAPTVEVFEVHQETNTKSEKLVPVEVRETEAPAENEVIVEDAVEPSTDVASNVENMDIVVELPEAVTAVGDVTEIELTDNDVIETMEDNAVEPEVIVLEKPVEFTITAKAAVSEPELIPLTNTRDVVEEPAVNVVAPAVELMVEPELWVSEQLVKVTEDETVELPELAIEPAAAEVAPIEKYDAGPISDDAAIDSETVAIVDVIKNNPPLAEVTSVVYAVEQPEKLTYSKSIVDNEVTSEEYSYEWQTYADDLDEEHWLPDDNKTIAPVTQKFKQFLAKFLGRQAFYAARLSDSNAR